MPSDSQSAHEAPLDNASHDARVARARLIDQVLDALLGAIVSGALRPSEAMTYVSDYLEHNRPQTADDTSVARGTTLADGAHGVEGIAVIDPYTRQLARWVAEGRMSGDEAVAFVAALVDVDASLVDPDVSSDPGYQVETAPWGVDLQRGVDSGDIPQSEATARASSAIRVERAFQKTVGASASGHHTDLRDQALLELIRDVLCGKRSEDDALSAGLRLIRDAHRPND